MSSDAGGSAGLGFFGCNAPRARMRQALGPA